jgi:hypothetical protein
MTLMISTDKPSFYPSQQVSFMGGEGVVRSRHFDLGTWTYLVEMTLGPKPNFGRVGAETMVILLEADLCAA